MHRPRTSLIAAAVFTLCASAAAVFGQNADNTEEQRLEFQAGGKEFKRNPVDNTFVNRFYNGVRTRRLDAVLTANEGIYESGPGLIYFFGNAAFEDSLRRLFADTLIYYEKIHEAVAIGNVRVIEGDRSLTADRVLYQKDIRRILATGNVTVRDDSSHSTITGATADFSDSTGYGCISGVPYLEKIEDDGSIMTVTCTDTLEIFKNERVLRLWSHVVAITDSMTLTCADTLEIHDKDKKIALWHGVTAVKDSLTTTSDYATYDDATNTLVLTEKPAIRYAISDTRKEAPSRLHTVSTVDGDTIRVTIHDKKVSGAEILGASKSVTSAIDSTGTLFDRSIIESSAMALEMKDDRISRIIAGGTAKSYYHRNYASDGKMFINEASGDTLTFFFDGGKISEMVIFGYGGGLGKGMYYDYEVADSLGVSVEATLPEAKEEEKKE